MKGIIAKLFSIRQAQAPTAPVTLRPVPSANCESYCSIDAQLELRQSEIISDLTFYSIEQNAENHDMVDTTSAKISYAIIATPDCDLLQYYKGRSPDLLSILFFAVEEADNTKQRMGYGSKEWKQVKQNQIERFHYINTIPAQYDLALTGIPDIVIDFKRYFTLPPSEVTRQCQAAGPIRANRRCRLNDLWREDMQRRAMSFMQRVGLPDPSDG